MRSRPLVQLTDMDAAGASPRELRFGELMYRRATGRSPEMECAKSSCRQIESHYRPGMSILDVGCGAGHYLASLQSRIDPAVDYRGIDASPHYIALAQSAFTDPARFSVGQAEQLPFDENSIDIVMCINVLPNLAPPPHAALSELFRVARHFVLIRTLIADVNYLIQEFEESTLEDPEVIDRFGNPLPGIATHNNIYSEQYLRNVIRSIDPDLAPIFVPDTHEHDFASEHPAGTRTIQNRQIAGALLLDWRFIAIPITDKH